MVVKISGRSEKCGVARARKNLAYLRSRAGISEYWIVNLADDCVEVRREPDPANRRYVNVAVARRGEIIEPVAMPAVRVPVDAVLPRRRR